MTLIRVMQLRDFRRLEPETVYRLARRCEVEFGRDGIMKPVFEFSETEKKMYSHFRNPSSKNKAYFETNLRLMAKSVYFHWMDEFDKRDQAGRTDLFQNITQDMEWWQSVYMDFLRAADMPIPSLAELYREFEEMIDGFKTDSSEEEIARIEAFKGRMNAAIVSRKVRGTVENFSGNVNSALLNVFGSFMGNKKNEESGEPKSEPGPELEPNGLSEQETSVPDR